MVAGACVAAIGAGGYFLLANSVDPDSGNAQIAGLGAEVRIVRDREGIPHVEAASRADAFRALGFAQASDRIWQMDVLRMVAQGRLSEMFGDATVNTDLFLKTLDIAGSAKASVSHLEPETLELLEAYAGGVNAWLNRETGRMSPRLPVEFIVLGREPEPWEAWHSLAILKVMALTLDGNMEEEIGRLTLAARGFSSGEIDEMFPAGPRDNPPALPDLRQLYGFPKTGKQRAETGPGENGKLTAFNRLAWPIGVSASNNWVIAGTRTQSGKPLLANDPHLGLQSPSVFYLAHLRYGEGDAVRNVIGGSLPGTPLILAGRNDRVAWGLTTTNLDAQDVFLEQLDPADPARYRTATGFEAFKTEDLAIKVSGADDVRFTRRETRHGPVLPDTYRKLRERLPEGHVAALSWIGLAHDDTTMDAAMGIMEAANVEDFMRMRERMVSPMQSIVVADVDGNIGLFAPGRAPLRNPGNPVAGRAPVPGWIDFYGWDGYVAPDELPRIVNPASGALATANANWLPPFYRHHITYDWEEHFRQARVEELFVASNRQQSPETMIEGMADTLSRAVMAFRDEALSQMPQAAGISPAMMTALANWDGHMLANSAEPLILVEWQRHFERAMLEDDLGDDFELVDRGNLTRTLGMLRNTGARDWCDRQDTPVREDCGRILQQSLEKAIGELRGRFGSDWLSWRWGSAHKSLHEHRPFTNVGLLSGFFTIRKEIAGGRYTLLRSAMDFANKEPLAATHGSAYRAFYDLSDLDRSGFINSTGVSGNVFSSRYANFADRWAQVKFLPMSVKPAAYRQDSPGTFILTPAAN